jgi:hypothetical protein
LFRDDGQRDRHDDFARAHKMFVSIDRVRFKQVSVAIYMLVCIVCKFSMNTAEVSAYRD